MELDFEFGKTIIQQTLATHGICTWVDHCFLGNLGITERLAAVCIGLYSRLPDVTDYLVG